jgi:hypothetical protein
MTAPADAGVWGTRTNTPDSLQNIKYESERHAFDERLEIGPDDLTYTKRMPSAFFETPLASYPRLAQGGHGGGNGRQHVRMRPGNGG